MYIIFTVYFLKHSNQTNMALDKYLHPEICIHYIHSDINY